jgi:hypothetical protein
VLDHSFFFLWFLLNFYLSCNTFKDYLLLFMFLDISNFITIDFIYSVYSLSF